MRSAIKSRRLVAAISAALMLAYIPPAGADQTWASYADSTIYPGVATTTGGNSCTSNFIFTDADNVYIGQAGHCSVDADLLSSTETNGCTASLLPFATPIDIQGGDHPGTMVYNSWNKMQANGESDTVACLYNDFALIRIHPDDVAKVNPTVTLWGGPTGLATNASAGDYVYSWGNSPVWLGIPALQPHTGFVDAKTNSRSYRVYTAPPGIPGDSGSGYMDSQGRALGVLSTIAIFPNTTSNQISDLKAALDYMHANTSLNVTLANGTEPFSGPF